MFDPLVMKECGAHEENKRRRMGINKDEVRNDEGGRSDNRDNEYKSGNRDNECKSGNSTIITTTNTSPVNNTNTTTNTSPVNNTITISNINTNANTNKENTPINVYLRIKPSDTVHGTVSNNTLTYNNTTYTFTQIFTKSSQTQIFDQIGKQTVINTIKGYNTTIFAYGQTGSGKTYTIKGDTHRPGMVPRILNYVFECGIADEVALSMLEIYNEKLRDLLCDNGVLSIREGIDGTYVSNLGRVVVRDYEMAMSVYERGSLKRRVGCMGMNRESSRSHCVFVVYFRGGDGVLVKESRINIVDLAGSERIRDGEWDDSNNKDGNMNCKDKDYDMNFKDNNHTGNSFKDSNFNMNYKDNNHNMNYKDNNCNMNYNYGNVQNTHTFNSPTINDRSAATIKETGNINKSLLSLREVIKKLGNNQNDHINYRDSKLTFLLKDSLGGNSNLTVIGTLNLKYKTESVHTLRFLQRAKHIKNTPTLSVGVKGDLDDIKRELTKVYARNTELEMQLKEYGMVGATRTLVGRYGDDIRWIRREMEKVRGMVNGIIGDVEKVVEGWFDRNREIISRMDVMLRSRRYGGLEGSVERTRGMVGERYDGLKGNIGRDNERVNDRDDSERVSDRDDNERVNGRYDNNDNERVSKTSGRNTKTINEGKVERNDVSKDKTKENNTNEQKLQQNEKQNVVNNKTRANNANCD